MPPPKGGRPTLATVVLIGGMIALAVPGSATFAGEFLILLGLFNAKLVIAIIAFTGVVLASVYMLRMFIRSMHNRLREGERSFDLSPRDALVLVPLVIAIVAFAVYPQQALTHSEPAVKRVVQASAPGAEQTAAAAQGEVTP